MTPIGLWMRRATAGACLLAAAHATTARAQGEVTGRVLSATDKRPIAGALLEVLAVGREQTTDSTGRFRFDSLPVGTQIIRVVEAGYISDSIRVVVRSGEVLSVDIQLRSSPGLSAKSSPVPPRDGVWLRVVVSDTAGQGIAYANLEIAGIRHVADVKGEIGVVLGQAGRADLDVRRIGYRPRRIALDIARDTSISVTLTPVAQELEGATITAGHARKSLELSGFYRRLMDRQKGIIVGHFFTEEDIERRTPHRITQMFEGIPAVRIRRAEQSHVTLRRCARDADVGCFAPAGPNGCAMMVYVDGRRENQLRYNADEQFAFGLDGIVLPSHVAGIEVYTGAGRVPAEYQSLAGSCGVILIWTK